MNHDFKIVDYSAGRAGKHVTVFGWSRSKEGAPDGRWEQAEKLGQLLGTRGWGVVTGGYNGSMAAVSKGARLAVPKEATTPATPVANLVWSRDCPVSFPNSSNNRNNNNAEETEKDDSSPALAGGVTVRGILAQQQFPDRETVGNQWLSEAIDGGEILKRLTVLCSMTRYYVTLPGTLGSLAELVLIWQQAALYPVGKKPLVLAFRFWEPVVKSCSELLQLPEAQVKEIIFVDTPEEAVAVIEQDWVKQQQTAAAAKAEEQKKE